MKWMLGVIALLSMGRSYCHDTEYSNEQEGVKVKVIGLDTKSPMIRIENSKSLTLAIRYPLTIAVSFWSKGERVLEKKTNGLEDNRLMKRSKELITFLPPGANIELPIDSIYFNIRQEGYGSHYDWHFGMSHLPSGTYTARFTSNGLGISVLDRNVSPFKNNFDIPDVEVKAP